MTLVRTLTLALLPLLAAPAATARSTSTAPSPPLLPVPAGCFRMGADEGGEPDEHPAHEVCVSAFLLDEHEVTVADYRACEAAGICPKARRFGPKFEGPQQAVAGVSWDGARAFCEWIGRRLPSEAEWEFAARGPQSRRFPWGDEDPSPERACYGWQRRGPAEVGSHPAGAGPFGHQDLGGNVWEWVQDVYHPGYYEISPRQDPPGGTCEESLALFRALKAAGRQGATGSNPIPEVCERVLRGGAWNYAAQGLRSSNRVHHAARFRIQVAGFRCAADAPPAGDPPAAGQPAAQPPASPAPAEPPPPPGPAAPAAP